MLGHATHLVVGDIDGLHDLRASRRVLRQPVSRLLRLDDNRGNLPSAVFLALHVLHDGHQHRLVP